MRNVYALLVGIDAYPNPPRPLSGCVNDTQAMRQFLEERIEPRDRLSLCMLLDGEATRDAIIKAFRSHLGQARKGDTALFFYAGHGSQEQVPELFRHLEPDGRCESLVAVDSRREGGYAVADKELRVLIAEIARNDAHVVVILDSCHSGSVTRVGEDVVARWTDPDLRKRSAETYWFFAPDAGLTNDERKRLEELGAADGWSVLPSGRHVALAACQDHEVAREMTDPEGNKRGAFTYHLIQSLEKLDGKARYTDLLKRAQVLVGNAVENQLPQGYGDLEAVLFDGAMPERPPVYHVRSYDGAGWLLDAGEVHGIEKGTELAVFPAGTDTVWDLGKKIATVTVTEADVAESSVDLREGSLPEDEVALPAVLTRLPTPPLRVAIAGGPDRKALEASIIESPFLRPASSAKQADVVVRQSPEGFRVRRPWARIDLAPPIPIVRDSRALVRQLEHIARWTTISELENPGSPLSGAVKMTIFQWDGPPSVAGGEPQVTPLQEGKEARLVYRGDAQPGRFTVRIHNRYQGDKRLYFCLLALDENFGVKRIEDASGQLSPDTTVWLRTADGISLTVPEKYYKKGVTQRRDIILLLVSEKPVDFDLLTQNGLGTDYSAKSAFRSDGSLGVLDTLLWQVGHRPDPSSSPGRAYREADADSKPVVAHQWGVQKQTLVAERSAPSIELSGARGEVELPGGVRLGIPEGLYARARLMNAPTAARRLGELLVPPPVSGIETLPVALAGELASDGGLIVLELEGDGFAAVTPQSPLWIESGAEIPADEVPVALVFDGAGSWKESVSEEKRGQGVRYRLTALPEPRGSGELARRVWVLFRSVRGAPAPKPHPLSP